MLNFHSFYVVSISLLRSRLFPKPGSLQMLKIFLLPLHREMAIKERNGERGGGTSERVTMELKRMRVFGARCVIGDDLWGFWGEVVCLGAM